MKAAYSRIMAKVSAVALGVAGVALVLMAIIMSYQVFMRFVLRNTPFWSEEVTLVLMIYFGFFSVGPAYRERHHIAVRLFVDKLRGKARAGLTMGIDVFMGLFGIFMLVFGIALMASTLRQTLPAMGISVGFSYLPIPLGGALIVFFAIEKILSPEIDGPAEVLATPHD